MTISVRRSGPRDRPAILALMDVARGAGLSDADRAERGFVQGNMTAEILSRFQAGTGVFIAEEGDELAGFAMTSEPGEAQGGPARAAIDAVRATPDGDAERLFLYGPAAVDARFQGRSVLTMLLAAFSRELEGRFDRGVAFVELANRKSLAVHRHYGMAESTRFRYDERDYAVFTFAPTLLASRTA